MIAELQQDLQRKYTWLKELKLHPSDALDSLTQEQPRVEEPGPEEPGSEEPGPDASAEGSPRAARLQIIVSRYRHKQNTALLWDVGQWAQKHGLDLEPAIFTEKEAQQLDAIGLVDSPTPFSLLEHLKASEDYPKNARLQVRSALDEIQRMLRGLEQEFPSSGLQAWNVGLRLEMLFEQLLAWGLAMLQREPTDTAADWSFLIEQLTPYHRPLAQLSTEHYPLQLHAFLQRHQQLTSLSSSSYGDNDLELESLLSPLEHLIRAMRRYADEKLMLGSEKARRINMVWWLTMSFSILVILAGLIGGLRSKPKMAAAVTLPKGKRSGGIRGAYYKGRNFEKFIKNRLDRQLNMRWRHRPFRGMPSDHFSVRWKGYIEAPKTGVYKLCLRYDDGAVMKLGKRSIVEDWRGGPARSRCSKLMLQAGWHPLHIKFFEFNGPASVRLTWQKPTDARPKLVPSRRLCCRN